MTTYYARNDVLYSGGDKLFSITFSYIKKEHIKVFVNDEETENFTFNNDSQILVSDELINGDVVSIRRTTPIDERMVVFSDTSILNKDNQNLAQTQMFDAVQEMKDDNTAFQININEDFSDYQDEIEGAFETYKNTIDNEIETIDGKADSAISTANSAETKANTAVSTANTANGKADNAVTTANSASTTANTALSTANSATTTANGAVLTANTASSTATAASNKVDALEEDITDVLEAAEKINELEEAVTTATTAATNAATAATNASTAAQTATTKAQEATNAAATFKQSDWNQTDTDAKDYIKNKPTIPSTSNLANKDLSNLSLSGFQVLNEQQTLQRASSISYGNLDYEFNFYTSIYKITIASNTTFVFPSNLVLPVRDVNFGSVTFELYIDMSSTVYSLTFPSSVSWQDGQTPDLSTTGKYFLVFRTFDNGTTWFGNLQGKW